MNSVSSPRADDESIEQEIQRKGLTAPRITPADLDAAIKSEAYYVFAGSQLTVCCLTLRNDFTVTGESACASPENFDADVGKKIARENAKQKLWPLLGYVLKENLYNLANGPKPITAQPPTTDAYVAVGSTRFSDGEIQTEASLTAARAEAA